MDGLLLIDNHSRTHAFSPVERARAGKPELPYGTETSGSTRLCVGSLSRGGVLRRDRLAGYYPIAAGLLGQIEGTIRMLDPRIQRLAGLKLADADADR